MADHVPFEAEGKQIDGFFGRVQGLPNTYCLSTKDIAGLVFSFSTFSLLPGGVHELQGDIKGHPDPVLFYIAPKNCGIAYQKIVTEIDRACMCKIYNMVRADRPKFLGEFGEFR